MNEQLKHLAETVKKRKKKEKRSKVITVSSGKGGVGKTGISISLAYSISKYFEKRVLLLDGDVGLGNVHVVLDLKPNKNLKSLINGEKIENVIQKAYGFDVILGFSGIDSFLELDSFDSSELLLQLEQTFKKYDYVIIDSGAGLNTHTVSFSRFADCTFIVTTPEPTSLTDAYAFIKSLWKLYDYDSFKIIVNMCPSKEEGFRVYERLRTSAKNFLGISLPLLGILPFSPKFKESLLKKRLLVDIYPSDPFSLEIKKIAQLVVGEILEPKEEKEIGFIQKLLSIFKK